MPDGPSFPELRPSDEQTASLALPISERTRVGSYVILEKLGEGGMGTVYLAEQTEPVKRRVALKVIKHGMDTGQVVARFEAERQALALMDHPAIAKMYEAGTTQDGRPYFAMEYVRGVPITEHCDRQKLSNPKRLDLFLQVCEGVQHAHQKAVIHRDLKPSNVLVGIQDGRSEVKIIDFGVAKAMAQRLTERSLYTELGVMIGTPEYMSPEQAEMTGQDVDTRSDVYSLGVMLYQLLVGALPFESKDLREAGFDEIRRRIREDEPPRPSARLATMGDRSTETAHRRQTEPKALRRELRGDLDWIVMRALEKDRARRYGSPSAIADDIRRYLQHEPVLARAPSAAYRTRKFLRRHRVGVAAATVMVLGLLAGTVGSTVGLVRAKRAERLAAAEEKRAEKVTKYLVDIFQLAGPETSQGATLTAREILDRQVKKVRESLKGDPKVQGRVMLAMGKAYTGLALYATGIPLLEEALPLLEKAYGRNTEIVYDALNELGNSSNAISAFAAARRYFESALDVATRLRGPDHADIGTIRRNLGDACVNLGDLAAGRDHLEAALALQTRLHGADSFAVAQTLSSFSALEIKAEHPEAAVEFAERSLAIRLKHYPPNHFRVIFGRFALGEAELANGRFDRAGAAYEAALPAFEKAYGKEHAKVGECLFDLAKAKAGLGHNDEAYRLYRRARAIAEKSFDANDPRLAGTLAGWLDAYAGLLRDLGKTDEAAATTASAATIRARIAPASSLATDKKD